MRLMSVLLCNILFITLQLSLFHSVRNILVLFHGCTWGSIFHSLPSLLRCPELNLSIVNQDQYLRMVIYHLHIHERILFKHKHFSFIGYFTFERRWSGLARTRRRKFTELRDPSICPELLRLHPVAWWRVKCLTVSLMFSCHKLLNDYETESVSLKRNHGSECKY